MVKYVKTDYVPDGTGYITSGKEYEVDNENCESGGYIINDRGRKIYIYYPSCAHLGGRAWTVINR